MTSSLSVPRLAAGAARARAIDGGRMKIVTRSSPIAASSCCVPCQSMSNNMSRPLAQRRLHRRLGRAVAIAEHVAPIRRTRRRRSSGRTRHRRRNDSRRRRPRRAAWAGSSPRSTWSRRGRRRAAFARSSICPRPKARRERSGGRGARESEAGPWPLLLRASRAPSSDRMLHCTKNLLKWCSAPYIVHCNIFRRI